MTAWCMDMDDMDGSQGITSPSLVLALHHCYQREQNIQIGLGVQREPFRCWTRNLFIIHNVLDQMDV